MKAEDFNRLVKWCRGNLKKYPNNEALIAVQELIEAALLNVKKRREIKVKIDNAINLIEQIKVGNTSKYQQCKSDAVALLQNVLELSGFKS